MTARFPPRGEQLGLFAEPLHINDRWPRHSAACQWYRKNGRRCYCARCDESRLVYRVFRKPRLFTLPRCMVTAGLSWGDVPSCMEGMEGPIAVETSFGRRLPL